MKTADKKRLAKGDEGAPNSIGRLYAMELIAAIHNVTKKYIDDGYDPEDAWTIAERTTQSYFSVQIRNNRKAGKK